MISIDDSLADPPYEQLRKQLLALIVDGTLNSGDKLPSVRQMAADLRIAPATVASAYRELERNEVIASRGRKGTFVTQRARQASKSARDHELATLTSEVLRRAYELGFTKNDVLDALRHS